jgi:hypothetical protein
MKKTIELSAETAEKSDTDYLGTILLESFRNKCILNFRGKTQKGKLRAIHIIKNSKFGEMSPSINDKVHGIIRNAIEEHMQAENLNPKSKPFSQGVAFGKIEVPEEEYLIFFQNKKSPEKILCQRPRPMQANQSASA